MKNNTPPQSAQHPTDKPDTSRRQIKQKLHDIIFEAETPLGRTFDVALLLAIVLSVIIVMLDTVPSVSEQYHRLLIASELVLTILFSIEYGLRLWVSRKPLAYAKSFYGIVDLIAILPTYLILFFPAAQSAAVLRSIRLIRIFRVLKLARFITEANLLRQIINRSKAKIAVFLSVVGITVVLMGTLIYIIESFYPEHTVIDSIPEGVYWAVVTLTTVGYGDLVPYTVAGKILATMMMLMGYALIVVPVAVFSAEFSRSQTHTLSTERCRSCGHEEHLQNAKYCHKCGDPINDPPPPPTTTNQDPHDVQSPPA